MLQEKLCLLAGDLVRKGMFIMKRDAIEVIEVLVGSFKALGPEVLIYFFL